MGLAARGFTYVVVALLAAQIALGGAAPSADQTGAIQEVGAQRFGRILLILLAFGFAAYALWRWSVAAFGAGTGTSTAGKAARRIGSLATGIAYASLCATAIRVASGGPSSSSSQRQQSTTGWLLGLPMGRALAAAVGIGVCIGGLVLVWWAVSRRFEAHLDTAKMDRRLRNWAAALGITGHIAGAALLFLVGAFVIDAAGTDNPAAAKGLDQSLRAFAGAPFGKFLVLAIALGLLAYGLYSFIEARYRRM